MTPFEQGPSHNVALHYVWNVSNVSAILLPAGIGPWPKSMLICHQRYALTFIWEYKNSHLGMANPTAVWTRKGHKSKKKYDKRWKLLIISKPWTCVEWAKIYTWQVCWFDGLTSGRYAWNQVFVMVAGPCAVPIIFTYFEKQFGKKICGGDKTRSYVTQHMFSPTFVPN